MHDNKRKFTLRVNDLTMDKISVISDLNKRSINAQIEFLLEKFVGDYEKENGLVKIDIDKKNI